MEYIMSKFTNRIKKYALSNFDSHLDESLQLSNLNKKCLEHANLQEDQDIRLRQIAAKSANQQINDIIANSRGKASFSLDYLKVKDRSERPSYAISEESMTLKHNEIQASNKNPKIKNKNFIELTNLENLESEKNIAFDHKIDKMRNAKLQPNDKDNKRLYFSSHKQMGQYKDTSSHNNYSKLNIKRINKNGINYIPIGYNGQRLHKKVSKISDSVKYNAHFIDMEIYVDPGIILMGSDGKQNTSKKENLRFNIFQKTREKKCNEILNSKNVHHAVFRAPAKKISDEEKKLEFERKFSNFVNNFEKGKVQLTFRELMQFKQIVYRRREEEYFLAQQEVSHHQKSIKLLSEQSIEKNAVSCKTNNNLVKKEQVNIENYKNYEDMISVSQQLQQFNKSTRKKAAKIESSFLPQKRQQLKRNINSPCTLQVRRPPRISLTYRREDSFER